MKSYVENKTEYQLTTDKVCNQFQKDEKWMKNRPIKTMGYRAPAQSGWEAEARLCLFLIPRKAQDLDAWMTQAMVWNKDKNLETVTSPKRYSYILRSLSLLQRPHIPKDNLWIKGATETSLREV